MNIKLLITSLISCVFSTMVLSQKVVITDTVLAKKHFERGDSLLVYSANYDSALKYYEKAAKIYQDQAIWDVYLKAKNQAIRCLNQQKKYDQAITEANKLESESIGLLGESNRYRADAIFNLGYSYDMQDDFDQAISHYEKAILIYKKIQKNPVGLANVYYHLAAIHNRGKYFNSKKALDYCQQAMEIRKANYPEDHPVMAETYYMNANILYYMSQFDSALNYVRMALEIQESRLAKTHISKIKTLVLGGSIHLTMLQLDFALKYYNKVVELCELSKEDNAGTLVRTYTNLGYLHAQRGNTKEGLRNLELALKLALGRNNKNDFNIAKIYADMGYAYQLKGDFELGLEFCKRAIALVEPILDGNHYFFADTYHQIALIHGKRGEITLASDALNKVIEIRKASGSNFMLAYAYNSMGNIFLEHQSYDEALAHYNKSLDLAVQLEQGIEPVMISNNSGIGTIYLKENNLKLALKHYNIAVGYAKKTENPFTTIVLFTELAEVYLELGDYDAALRYSHKSILTNILDFNDSSIYTSLPLEKAIDKYRLLEALFAKSLALEGLQQTEQEENLKDLKFSHNTLQVCDTLIDQMRQSHLKFEDKKNLAKKVSNVYQASIRISLALYEKTRNIQYAESAFYFSEKSRAGILNESINTLLAKNMDLLPQPLLELEQEIKIDKSFHQSQINEEKTKTIGYDTTKVIYHESMLFETTMKLDSLIVALEQQYPKYHQIKYQNRILTPKEIQQKVEKNTMLIEYFQSESSIYAFVITKKDFKVFETKITEGFDEKIVGMMNTSKQFNKSSITDFKNISYQLSEILLRDPLNYLATQEGIDHLAIIPSSKLSYIPFEILLIEEVKEDESYMDLPYLINDYSVSYGYSAALKFNEREEGDRGNDYLGYAPTYTTSAPAQLASLGTFRDAVVPLKWNAEEVSQITDNIGGKIQLAATATEANFKKEAKNYNILHLAMHALIDDTNPMNSKLVFAQNETDEQEDGYLHTYELFNMDLNPELVVLSACNTSYGQLAEGEGMMSLAYGFAYAGCPSLVASHWQVDDQSTSELMNYFYQHLSSGKTKSASLRQAKLDYLKTASPNKLHPFFWSSFVVIGDDRPVFRQDKIWWYAASIIGLLLLIGVGWSMRRRTTRTLN